jgi:hypothetical protein
MDDFEEKKAPWSSYTAHIIRVVVEEGVTNIGDYAFAYCPNMVSVMLPTTVMDLGACAFGAYGPSLEITFTGAAPTISDNALGCQKYLQLRCYYPANDPTWTQDVLIPAVGKNYQTTYGGFVVWESDASVVGKWGNGVVSSYDKQTKTLTLTGSGSTGLVSDLARPWADYQSEVKKVVIEDYVNRLVVADFKNHTALEEVLLPDELLYLGGSVFQGCTSLKKVVFPAKMTGIAMNTFKDCTELTELVFTGDAPNIDSTAFTNVTASAAYPGANESWPEAKLQNYGGTLTWKLNEQ